MPRRRNGCRPTVVTPHTRGSQGGRLPDAAVATLAVAREPVDVQRGRSRSLINLVVTFWSRVGTCVALPLLDRTSIPRAACSSQWGRGPDSGPPTPGEGRATWIARTGRALAARPRRQPPVNTRLLQR